MRDLILASMMAMLVLAGCQTTAPPETPLPADFHVTQVNVSLASGTGTTETFQNRLRNALTNHVTAYNALREGEMKSYTLNVDVTEVNFLSPMKDLLTGDVSYVRANAALVDRADGSIVKSYAQQSIDNVIYDFDGLNKDPTRSVAAQQEMEAILVRALAADLMKRIYSGTALPPDVAGRLNSDAVLQAR